MRVGAVCAVLADGGAFFVADLADDIARWLGRVFCGAVDARFVDAAAAAGFVERAVGGYARGVPDHLTDWVRVREGVWEDAEETRFECGEDLGVGDSPSQSAGCGRGRIIAHAEEVRGGADEDAMGTLELVASAEADAAVDFRVGRDRVFDVGRLRQGVAVLGDHDIEDRRPHCLLEVRVERAHVEVDGVRLNVGGCITNLDRLALALERDEARVLESLDEVAGFRKKNLEISVF